MGHSIRFIALLQLLFVTFTQLPCLCAFPSKEFYDGKLKTSPTVVRRYASELERLKTFWPSHQKQFVFCDVVGSEAEHHTGQDGTAAVGAESKRNNKEAKKIVSPVHTFSR